MESKRVSFSYNENNKRENVPRTPFRNLTLTETRLSKKYEKMITLCDKINLAKEEEMDLERAQQDIRHSLVKKLRSTEQELFSDESFIENINKSQDSLMPNITCERNLRRVTNVIDSLAMSESDLGHHDLLLNLYNSESYLLIIYRLCLIILVLYALTLYPAQLYISQRFLKYSLFLQEALSMGDIYLHFNTQQFDEEENLILSRNEINDCLFKNGIFYDLLVSLPFYSVFILSTLNTPFCSHEKVLVLTACSCLKLIKLYLLFRWLLSLNKVKMLLFRVKSLNLAFYYLCFLIMFLHINSLFFLLNSVCSRENWVEENNLAEEYFTAKYVASLYFSVVTVLSVGYGDLKIQNLKDKSYVVVLLVVGVILYSLTLASLSSTFTSVSEEKKKFKRRMAYLDKIAEQYKLNANTVKRLRNHCTYEYKHGTSHLKKLFKGLPYTYVMTLKKRIYKNDITKIKFLKNKIKEFQFMVIDMLKESFCVKGDLLIEEKDKVDEVVIVREGVVGVKIKVIDNRITVLNLHKYEHFGDVYLILKILSPFTLIVKSKVCKTYSLSREDFFEVRKCFPNVMNRILKNSHRNVAVIERKANALINTRTDNLPKRRRKTVMQETIVCAVRKNNGRDKIVFNTKSKLKLAGKSSFAANVKPERSPVRVSKFKTKKSGLRVNDRKSKTSKNLFGREPFQPLDEIIEQSLEKSIQMYSATEDTAIAKLDKMMSHLKEIKTKGVSFGNSN